MEKKIQDRVAREREWHDNRFMSDSRPATTSRFYIALEAWYDDYQNICINSSFDKALEIGAGLESLTAHSKMMGRKVIAVDVSQVVINRMNQDFKGDSFEFIVADAHQMSFDNSNFDLIFARGVLHHLDLNVAIKELKRVLIPNGKIVFAEPLDGNPLIKLYRHLTPRLRTPDEKPLSKRDIDFIYESFGRPNINYYGFLCLIPSIIFRRNFAWIKILDDYILNKLKMGPYLAWACIISNSNDTD